MNIDCWGDKAGVLKLNTCDERMLKLAKSRVSSKCGLCKKHIPMGSYCLGGGCYTKICLKCYESFLFNFLNSLEAYKNKAKYLIDEIKSKNQRLMKNNILAKVGDTEQDDE